MDFISGWTSFCSNNFNQPLPVAVTHMCALFRSFEPFYLQNLFSSAIFLGCLLCTSLDVIFQYLYFIKVWGLIGPLQKADFLSFWSHCVVQRFPNWGCIRYGENEFTSGGCPDPDGWTSVNFGDKTMTNFIYQQKLVTDGNEAILKYKLIYDAKKLWRILLLETMQFCL